MGLTESKKKELHDKKFDDLYVKHKPIWTKMAQEAAAFARKHISKGSEPLADDILKYLVPMLEVNDVLRKHQEDRHAKYRRFRESFGEYIVEDHLNPQHQGEM
jgi:hypothetical protein